MRLELLMAIVHNQKAAYFSSLIQSHRANIQLTMAAKGTSHLILSYLGLEEAPKSLIVGVVRSDQAADLIATLDEVFHRGREYKGVAWTVPFSSMIGSLVYGFLSDDKRTVREEV